MTFESEGLLIVAIYIWLPPASYVVFLTTLVIVPRLSRKRGTLKLIRPSVCPSVCLKNFNLAHIF